MSLEEMTDAIRSILSSPPRTPSEARRKEVVAAIVEFTAVLCDPETLDGFVNPDVDEYVSLIPGKWRAIVIEPTIHDRLIAAVSASVTNAAGQTGPPVSILTGFPLRLVEA